MPNYIYREFSLKSADRGKTLRGAIWEPRSKVKGILMISHGMIDHIDRYHSLGEYFTEHGYVVAGASHLGHGKTADSPEELGYFSDKGAIDNLLDDLYSVSKMLKQEFPDVPLTLMGHSMGSFLSRLFVNKYPDAVSGHIIHGTGGSMILLPIGKLLAKSIILFRGRRHRSKFLAAMAFMGYNSKFQKSEGFTAWLTQIPENVEDRKNDPYARFIFTASAYLELFRMVGRSNSGRWYSDYKKNLKTLILSGDMDPVGAYGKGPTQVYNKLCKNGALNVTLKLYEGCRHELFNDKCREESFADILSFMETLR